MTDNKNEIFKDKKIPIVEDDVQILTSENGKKLR